jgi:hypothetical protein
MTPEERQMLAELFERVRSVAGNPRDTEAEAAIAEAAHEQPHALYVLAQTALLQRQALDAAAQRIQELEARLAPEANAPSFLGDLGHSLLGAEHLASRPPAGPWGAPPIAPPREGFLAGVMSSATGVAGGMLAANAIEHLLLGGETPAPHVHDSATGSAATPADVKLPEADPDHDAFVDPAEYEVGGDFDDAASDDSGVDV